MLSPELPEKTYVVAYNKMELLEAYENWLLFKEKQQAHGIKTFCMSAVKRESTHMKYKDSERRFQHVLEAFGVNKPLSKMGVKEGDSVIVGEVRRAFILLICQLSSP
uniref:OCT domain-containing protein n=1 Tax=Populus alba TaxID=43335 RepID=A0A4U5NP45_POPAL|nr:hypothetical protein D5086_0000248590 [Populus alba]